MTILPLQLVKLTEPDVAIGGTSHPFIPDLSIRASLVVLVMDLVELARCANIGVSLVCVCVCMCVH
jgi:hypothetical protein